MMQLKKLVAMGFPISQCVLRIDPIFPTDSGLKRVCEIIDNAYLLKLLPDIRVRISVLDEYKHVKERFKSIGFNPIYGENFYAPKAMMQAVAKTLSRYNICYETCAEKYLGDTTRFERLGCVSNKDLKILGLTEQNVPVNMQNRSGCLCLSCKTELLENKCQCPHRCLYCYWRPNCEA